MEPINLSDEQKQRIELWCQALESGKYKQTTGQLKERDAYCCLGVACEVSGLGTWSDKEQYRTANSFSGGDSPDGDLPDDVVEFFGVRYSDPTLYSEDGDTDDATVLNDSQGYTFPRIAAAIRRTYLEAK